MIDEYLLDSSENKPSIQEAGAVNTSLTSKEKYKLLNQMERQIPYFATLYTKQPKFFKQLQSKKINQSA